MADLFRNPLGIARREFAPVLALASIVALGTPLPLLATPAPLPIGKAHLGDYKQHPQNEWLPAETSRMRPKTLFADNQLPVGARSFPEYKHHPQNEWLNPNTTVGTPKTLTADAQRPVGVAAFPIWQSKPAQWLNPSTAQSTPLGLILVAPAPIGASNWVATPAAKFLPQELSAGIPKALTSDAQAPVGQAAFPLWQSQPAKWLNPNSSLGSPLGLILPPVIALPPGSQALPATPAPVRTLLETSSGTPKTLVPDAQAPVGAAATVSAPPAVQPPSNTTASSPIPLVSVIVAPPGAAQTVSAPAPQFLLQNTSSGTPKTLVSDVSLPVGGAASVKAPSISPLLSNTSASTPAPLVAVIVAPVGQAQTVSAPALQRALLETSAGTPKVLIPDAQLPVGKLAAVQLPAPVIVPPDRSQVAPVQLIPILPVPIGQATQVNPWKFHYNAADQSLSTNPGLFPPGPPIPPTPPAVTYGGVWMYGLTHWRKLRGELEDPPLPVIAEISEVVQRIPEPTTGVDAESKLLLRLELEKQNIGWRDTYLEALDAYREGAREFIRANRKERQQAREQYVKYEAEQKAKIAKRNRHLAILLLSG